MNSGNDDAATGPSSSNVDWSPSLPSPETIAEVLR